MKRYILFAFAFALGWLCLVSGQGGACTGNKWKDGNTCSALQVFKDDDTVNDIPLAGKCAHDDYTIKFKEEKKIYEYSNVKDAEECQLLCQQWANCDIWRLDYTDNNNKKCGLIQREAFQNQEFSKLRISGYNDCPRSYKCLENDKFYYQNTPLKTEKNVEDPYACQIKCEKHSGCTHFVYSMATGTEDTCYLLNGDFGKIASGAQKVNNKEPVDFVSGAADCNYCFEFHLKYDLLPRIAHAGGAASVSAVSHTKCQEICFANPLCLWFEWFTKEKKCFMTHPFHLLEAKNDVVTGLRDCDLDLACGQCDANGLKNPNGSKHCDAAGNCKCKANYDDKFCTKCKKGFTRAANGTCS